MVLGGSTSPFPVTMSNLYRSIALSDRPTARGLRAAYRGLNNMSLPAPGWMFCPLLYAYLALREGYYFISRVFVCEPFFKACCTRYGRNLHTGNYIHAVKGRGNLIVGDNVVINGKCRFEFGYAEEATLRIGDHVFIEQGTSFTIGREIAIGNWVQIGPRVEIFDTPGHPVDPGLRRAKSRALPEDVKPVRIGDGVWIGRAAVIFPGVTIGEGSVVAAAAVVMSNVPANVVVAGNPARLIAKITEKGG
jgi:acetyltransferase-like isoleucine patch superfamily enzyme